MCYVLGIQTRARPGSCSQSDFIGGDRHEDICFFFWGGGGQAVPHTQLSQSEIKPMPPALEVWSLNYWTDREMQNRSFLI